MSICKIHFLNVGNGDCIIIEHQTGRISIIDICNGNGNNGNGNNIVSVESNFNYQKLPTNPIEYIQKIRGDKPIFRFILTHPDMDHMDGIKNLFKQFKPEFFWDTNHCKDLSNDDFKNYKKEDWDFYKSIRKSDSNPKTLKIYKRYEADYYTEDGFEIISPSQDLVEQLKKSNKPNWNEISYVILHKVSGKKVLYCGDSENMAWENILLDSDLLEKIKDIDILIAPHHGRKTGGDKLNEYLDKIKPKLALFGNAESSNKNYQAFYNRGIPILTNNEAGNIVVSIQDKGGIYLEIDNDWNTLLKTKNKDFEEILNKSYIYLQKLRIM